MELVEKKKYEVSLRPPSRYSSLSLIISYLALEDGAPIFGQV